MRLGSFQWNEASFIPIYKVMKLIFGLKSVAAKAATAATVPTPLVPISTIDMGMGVPISM